ncbi:hypothetical protein OAX78_00100 [Planctomycetota bacterium]|nr:hypothetical protein [Planctomycetota bacterium]
MLSYFVPARGEKTVLKVPLGQSTYYYGRVGLYRCVLTSPNETGAGGPEGAGQHFRDALQAWRPHAAIMPGIAFGNPKAKRLQLHDVVVASQLHRYDRVKLSDGSPLSPPLVSSATLRNRAKQCPWTAPPREKGQTGRSPRERAMISGEAYVDNVEDRDRVFASFPDAEAGEMEGVGLAAAAERERVDWLVVKAISDWGDGKGDSKDRGRAAKNACSFVASLLGAPGLEAEHFGRVSRDAELQLLETLSREWLEETRETLGDGLHIDRPEIQERVRQALSEARVVALVGESGTGKSAAAKVFAQAELKSGEVCYCLDALDLVRSREGRFSGGRDLAAVLKSETAEGALLVLDGLQQLLEPELVRALVSVLNALDLSGQSRWRCLATCNTEEWDRLLESLRGHQVDLPQPTTIAVGVFDKNSADRIAAEIPKLAAVLVRKDLRPIVLRPKVVDILARATVEVGAPDPIDWLGESDVIAWIWKAFIEGGSRGLEHSGLLQRLATEQAELGTHAKPAADLTSDDVQLIPELCRIGVLRQRHGSVRFSHDLYADYSRQRRLLADLASGVSVLTTDKCEKFRWHRALRLLGLDRLEREAGDLPSWRTLFTETQAATDIPRVAADLLLEALGASLRSDQLLEQHADLLRADQGALLGRFLTRFFFSATIAHPRVAESASEMSPGSQSTLAARYRTPAAIWQWIPVIRWVVSAKSSCLELCPQETFRLAEAWLLTFQAIPAFPTVTAVAGMVLDLAELSARHRHRRSLAKDRGQLLSIAMLAGALGPKSRARDLAETLAGLRLAEETDAVEGAQEVDDAESNEPEADPTKPTDDNEVVVATEDGEPGTGAASAEEGDQEEGTEDADPIPTPDFTPFIPVEISEGAKEPWPEGPRGRVDSDFQRAMLQRPGCDWLIALGTSFARRVLLALLIEPPPRTTALGEYASEHSLRDCGLQVHHQASYPAFYDFAPSYLLLRAAPDDGLEFVLGLIGFATERWAEAWAIEGPRRRRRLAAVASVVDAPDRQTGGAAPSVTTRVEGEVACYVGDKRLFHWHTGIAGPHVASAVLMSLEHWLYERLDEDDLKDETLHRILECRSVATLSVLYDVAMRDHSLLLGPLEPLVEVQEFYDWSCMRLASPHASTALIAWTLRDPATTKLARQWHGQAHRLIAFQEVVGFLLRDRGASWPALDAARQRWIEEQPGRVQRDPSFNLLVATLDPANWVQAVDDSGKETWRCQPPASVFEALSARAEEAEEARVLLTLPMRLRFLIDGKAECSEEGMERLLRFARDLEEIPAGLTDVLSLEVVRAGVGAAAIRCHSDWLEKQAEWTALCRDWVTDLCYAPPAPRRFDSEGSTGEEHWDSFVADAVPVLWVSVDEDASHRGALAHFVFLALHDSAVARFFRILSQQPGLQRQDFEELLLLSVWASRLRFLGRSHLLEEAPKDGLVSATLRLTSGFVAQKALGLCPEWAELASAWPPEFPDPTIPGLRERLGGLFSRTLSRQTAARSKRRRRRVFGFMENRLASSFMWIESTAGSADGWLRDTALTCLVGWLGYLKTRLTWQFEGREGGHWESREFPFDSDRAMARVCARWVLAESEPDRRASLIEPWMTLRVDASDWGEEFLSHLYFFGLRENPEGLATVLAQLWPGVSVGDGTLNRYSAVDDYHYHFDLRTEFACALLGCQRSYEVGHWGPEHQELVTSLAPIWRAWCDVALLWEGCTERFLALSATSAAAPLRSQILGWLGEFDLRENLKSDRVQEALVDLVETANAEGEPTSSFATLLTLLVELQNARAILLAATIADEGSHP